MDKSDLAVIVGAFVTVATGFGSLVWRMFRAWLDQRTKERDEDRTQTKEQTTAMLTLAHRLESVEKALDRVEFRVERASGVHDVPHEAIERAQQPEQPRRTSTPARGVGEYRVGRLRTEPGG